MHGLCTYKLTFGDEDIFYYYEVSLEKAIQIAINLIIWDESPLFNFNGAVLIEKY